MLAWYRPDRGLGYDHVLRLGWQFIERRVPVDRTAGVPVYLSYAVFDGKTRKGAYWQHNPASLYASFVESLIPWYAYSGDRRAVGVVRSMLDYQLSHGTTPGGWAWPRVPFPTSCAGAKRYGGCLGGEPRAYRGGVEPDKVGLLGYAYARFYELTGQRRYLAAAVACADALARHVEAGDARHTPWPFRVDGRTGKTIGGAVYGGMVVAPVRLFDELIRLRAGDTTRFRRARDTAWRWVMRYPLNPGSEAFNRWSGFYEDVRYEPEDLNGVTPTTTAYYLLTQSSPASVDPAWRTDAARLLEWVRSYLGKGPFDGAWAIDEQKRPGRKGCCSPAGLGSDTARWGAVNALLAARTGNGAARERAIRSLNYATYFARSDGRVSCCGSGFRHAYWFSDGYGDYLGSFSWALGALPELAPSGQNHVLASTSVIRAVSYQPHRVAYTTFRSRSREVVRLSYRPVRVLAGDQQLPERRDLTADGYSLRPLPHGDFVLRVRHDRARSITVVGSR